MDTATIQLADVADMDFRVTIQKLDGHDDLTKEEKDDVNNLALFWDLPVVNTTNRSWLFQKLLQHAVIGRTKRQIKQIRRGLKDTRVLELLIERPDTVPLIFPRSANIAPSAQAILSNIVWPGEEGNGDDDEDDDEDTCPKHLRDRTTGFLRRFIETASAKKLQQLIRFWVGWEIPSPGMKVEVVRENT
ncbi:hypothetical protein AAFF_G00022010 [Aldrovandia affinis]|uniref:Uncharacterized protein n=1 Tax=Aldrovandia affinis TaxID=143900 RepID=A0AAD7S545_9TELE|nr:hypothetical protein AAFF_G00022010 [Aldrovandia affinis]